MDEFPLPPLLGDDYPLKHVKFTDSRFEDAAVPTGSLRPDPGTICPTCGEKTPNEHALEMRRWRAKSKTRGTEQKERKNE